MAKVKFGQIISEARGKIAGMVFSKNRSGCYVRQKVTPINPGTGFQSAVRLSMRSASKAWQTFSDSVRNEFIYHASSVNSKDSLGNSVRISGFNFFVGLCRDALSIGQVAPVAFPGRIEPTQILSCSGACSYGPDKIELSFTPAIPAADSWIIYATAPLSLGINFVKSEYRIIGVLVNGNISPFDVTALYTAKFGAIPQVGKQCFFKLAPVNIATFARISKNIAPFFKVK
jgi:hypothetical protein